MQLARDICHAQKIKIRVKRRLFFEAYVCYKRRARTKERG